MRSRSIVEISEEMRDRINAMFGGEFKPKITAVVRKLLTEALDAREAKAKARVEE